MSAGAIRYDFLQENQFSFREVFMIAIRNWRRLIDLSAPAAELLQCFPSFLNLDALKLAEHGELTVRAHEQDDGFLRLVADMGTEAIHTASPIFKGFSIQTSCSMPF